MESATARETTAAASHATEAPQHVSQQSHATGLDALRIVLEHRDTEDVVALRRQLSELRQACPALCAQPGTFFEHRLDTMMVEASFDGEHEIFEFLGRTAGGGKAPNPCHGTPVPFAPYGPPKVGPYAGWEDAPAAWQTPAGWLSFRHIDGPPAQGGTNTNWRNVVGAWPRAKYRDYQDDHGTCEEDVVALPPEMCWAFRTMGRTRRGMCSDDEDDDEEDE